MSDLGDTASKELLSMLDKLNNTLNGSGAASSNNNSPMFRSAAPAWAPFNSLLANMAYGGISGAITKRVMGGAYPQQAPLMPGMNSLAGSYAAGVTGPAIGTGLQASDTNIAAMGGRFLGDLLDTAGVRKLVAPKMSSKAFRDNVAGAAQGSSIARGLVLMGMQTEAAQALTGGDIVGGSRRMYGATALGGDGQVLNLVKNGKLDRSIGLLHAQKTSEMTTSLLDSMFQREDGKYGITPNMSFTKGFDTGQIMDMHTLMSERGYEMRMPVNKPAVTGPDGATSTETEPIPREWATPLDTYETINYRDATTAQRTEMLESQLNAMSALRDVSGETDLGALNEIYNTFAGGAGNKANPDDMARAFDTMSSMAAVFGKEGKAFVESAMNLQQTLAANAGKVLGGSATAMLDAGGNIRGGLGSVEVATSLATNAYGLATARGDTSARAVAMAGEEQQAANAVWLGSTQGKDAMLMEWMNQTKQLSEGSYAAWTNAMDNGDKQAQLAAANNAFQKSSFGSASTARAALNSPAFRAELAARLGPEAALNLLDRGIDTMSAELEERTKSDSVLRSGKTLTSYVRKTKDSEESLKAAEKSRVAAMVEAAGKFGAGVQEAYDKGGMSEVRQLMHTNPALEDVAGEMELEGNIAANKAMVAALEKGGVKEDLQMQAGLASLADMTDVDQNLVRDAQAARRTGKPEEAQRLYAEAREQAGKRSTFVDAAEKRAAEVFAANLKTTREGADGTKASEAARLMSEVAGGVAGFGQLFKDTAEGRKQAKAAEKLAAAMVEAGIPQGARRTADENRATLPQRTADFLQGNGDILDVLGIVKPQELTGDEIKKLGGENSEVVRTYRAQRKQYKDAKDKYGGKSAEQIAVMSWDKLVDTFGEHAGDVSRIQEKGENLDGEAKLAEALSGDQLNKWLGAADEKGVRKGNIKGADGEFLTAESSVDDFLASGAVAADATGEIGTLATQLEGRMGKTVDSEKSDGKGGTTIPEKTTAVLSGESTIKNAEGVPLGTLLADGIELVIDWATGGGD